MRPEGHTPDFGVDKTIRRYAMEAARRTCAKKCLSLRQLLQKRWPCYSMETIDALIKGKGVLRADRLAELPYMPELGVQFSYDYFDVLMENNEREMLRRCFHMHLLTLKLEDKPNGKRGAAMDCNSADGGLCSLGPVHLVAS